jgi:transposase
MQARSAPSALDPAVEIFRTRAKQLGLSVEQSTFVSSLLASFEQVSRERQDLDHERVALAAELERSELRVKKLTFLAYGKKTERLSREELIQLVLSFGGSAQQAHAAEPEVPHDAAPDEPTEQAGLSNVEPTQNEEQAASTSKRKRPNHPGRSKLSPELERVIDPIRVPAEQRLCACCQHEMQVIGHVDHERIEYVPAKVVVHVERREKLACRRSECRGDITTAPRVDEAGPRRRAGASLLAQLIEAKCDDGLPVERQRDQWRRLGFDVPANTLYTYWTHATSLLLPVAKIVLAQVLADPIVGVDDTSLSVLDKERKAGIYKGHLWCFTGTRRLVAYTFTESWSADEIAPYLAAIDGFVQCDDYKGYSREVALPDGTRRALVDPLRRLGCTMHVRRRFHEALKLGDKRAARGVELLGALYAIERAAKEHAASPEQRLGLRTDWSLPLLDTFDTWVDDQALRCLPRSPLGQALGYAQNQRPFVRRCFTDGRFEIDNGHTERILREPCMGRKAYLFTGSAKAAERLAGAYTLVQSCRLLGFAARDYLVDVLQKLDAGWPMRRIAELVPDRWALEHARLPPTDHTK